MVPMSPRTQRKEQVKLWVKEEEEKMKLLPLNEQVALWKQLRDGCIEQCRYWGKEVEKNKKYSEQFEKRITEAMKRSVNGSLQSSIDDRLCKLQEYTEEAERATEKSKLHLEESYAAEARYNKLIRSRGVDLSSSMGMVVGGVSGAQQQCYQQ